MARRRHLNIRGKSANLPAITERDWLDIKFGVDVGVDYYALSFVRNADVIYELKHWLAQQGACAVFMAGIARRETSWLPLLSLSKACSLSCAKHMLCVSSGTAWRSRGRCPAEVSSRSRSGSTHSLGLPCVCCSSTASEAMQSSCFTRLTCRDYTLQARLTSAGFALVQNPRNVFRSGGSSPMPCLAGLERPGQEERFKRAV